MAPVVFEKLLKSDHDGDCFKSRGLIMLRQSNTTMQRRHRKRVYNSSANFIRCRADDIILVSRSAYNFYI